MNPSTEHSTPEHPQVDGVIAAPAGPPIASPPLTPATSLPADFEFDEVRATTRTVATTPPVASLGPLAAFVGNWRGSGFNTIFRPDNPESRSSEKLPHPLPPTDNILELNLTSETLSFSESLGNVPNRGRVQEDIFLNGVPYLQAVQDVTTGKPIGIHLEPGLWMAVPVTEHPAIAELTLARMASIPHGTTICAQGTSRVFKGPPTIPPVDITPFLAGNPADKIGFPSQEASNAITPRIPQDLSEFIAQGTITQAILNDPNTVLRNHNVGQHVTSTTEISISTSPATPLFGGGTDNIAFLLGNPGALVNPDPPGQNAQSVTMSATFWIEEIEITIIPPPFRPGQPPLKLSPESSVPGRPLPTFLVRPPIEIPKPPPITIIYPQIQYSQVVNLNFEGLTWPHVSVATLVPSYPISVPPSVWS